MKRRPVQNQTDSELNLCQRTKNRKKPHAANDVKCQKFRGLFMSPEKEKQKNQFKKKKRKRRKIKNMKGMIASFIIAFLIVSMLAIFVYSLNPVFSDENTIPVSGTVISVTGETRRNRYQRKPWVIIELDNGEKYEIAGGLLKKSGWDMKELQNQILYKKVTVRYPKEKIASLFSIN